MKFRGYAVSSLLVISSVYFSLLLLQAGSYLSFNLNSAHRN
jgi:hypothetical protein